MINKLSNSIKLILAGAAVVASSSAYAFTEGGGVGVSQTWAGGSDVLGSNVAIQGLNIGINTDKSWTSNPTLGNDAWGHAGAWYAFDNTATQNVVINAAAVTGNYDIAFTVWATGSGVFNGGTNGATSGYAEAGPFGTPAHDFNQVSQLGANGTIWMANPTITGTGSQNSGEAGAGNALETLAYANSGVSGTNSYGGVINTGINQVATDNTYFSGSVGGYTTSSNGASQSDAYLQFNNLAAGWYVIFLGGANNAETVSTNFNLTVASGTASAVPLPGAVYMFGAGIAGLMAAARRKSQAA
jgi:hypothetical protein